MEGTLGLHRGYIVVTYLHSLYIADYGTPIEISTPHSKCKLTHNRKEVIHLHSLYTAHYGTSIEMKSLHYPSFRSISIFCSI